ncbi:MAG: Gfo/Idh/MocA family oxidoreductase [Calditrichae bacterium]|nr:Gfo/Idh/MocA family oxidoreductase [Calditrichia bacterium]
MKKISRRQFLKNSTAVAAVKVIAPRFSFAFIPFLKNRSINDRINVACIGVGGMGTANLKDFLEKKDCTVVAVCDVDKQHCENARQLVNKKYQNNDCHTYHDFREVLVRDDIDAIMTATPDHWHALIAVAAARVNKDIYAEKPLAFNISEGRAIVDAVEQYGVVWQTGSWQRSQQHFRHACELVRNGRIGHIHTVRVGLPYGNSIDNRGTQPGSPPDGFDYEMWLGPAPWRPYNPSRCHWNFRWISDYSQGQLTDWAGHHCDIANWGMGTEESAPQTIEGIAHYPDARDGLFDTAESYRFECQYREGFRLIVADSTQQPKGMGVHFIGDEGWIHVNRVGISASSDSILKSKLKPDEIHLYKSDNHVQNFLDCVRTRKLTVTPVKAAHYAIMVAHLGNAAMHLGRELHWDMKTEKFVNDPQADRFLTRPMRGPWHL